MAFTGQGMLWRFLRPAHRPRSRRDVSLRVCNLELLQQVDSTRELLRQDSQLPQGRVSVGLPSSAAHVEFGERKLANTALLSNAVQKVKTTVFELFDGPNGRNGWRRRSAVRAALGLCPAAVDQSLPHA